MADVARAGSNGKRLRRVAASVCRRPREEGGEGAKASNATAVRRMAEAAAVEVFILMVDRVRYARNII